MSRFKSSLVAILCGGFLMPVALADMIGDFSRANCINNESISWWPSFPTYRAVITWHYDTYLGDLLHFAGDEDPVFCATSPCPTSNLLNDATCWPWDNCGWTVHYGVWFPAVHSTNDAPGEPPGSPRWRVEGRHVTMYSPPPWVVYATVASGPVNNCNL
jgi:hypothetical protein